MAKPKSLVIVESPAKAGTIKKILGKDFDVKASIGHIKNLPTNRLGVDVDNGFTPEYVTIKGKANILKEIREASKKADNIYLAPDPDREGEAIAYHVSLEIDSENKEIYRVLFNEITRNEVIKAINNPGRIDKNKVDAQQARRILDRLVGYKISPLLWKKVQRGLSAGRVQSVALRLICERQREIELFVPEEYWSITGTLKGENPPPFEAKLLRKGKEKIRIENGDQALSILSDLKGAIFKVSDIQKKEGRRNPVPPFITSTLQQEASRRFHFSPKRTMVIVQRLYEGIDIGEEGPVGLVTYMRTDSTRVSEEAISAVRDYIATRYGAGYIPKSPNRYKSRKGAQEAHEAIRPTSVMREPTRLKGYLDKEEMAIYEVIWKRFVASQMPPAIMDVTTIDVEAGNYTFRASGSVIRFEGFMKVYVEKKEEEKEEEKEGAERDEKEKKREETLPETLPLLKIGEVLELLKIIHDQHFTQPPPKYTEATLIKELEENGIGRPSTYATIISTIQNREYVRREKRNLYPTPLGFLITDLLVENFPDILNVEFTANMEDHLDKIEEGSRKWMEIIQDFYNSFQVDIKEAERNMRDVKREIEHTDEICEKCGKGMVIRWGRYGKFLSCSGYPECKNTREIEKREDRDVKIEEEVTDERCDKCGAAMVIKNGRYGRFMACSGYPECKSTKPINIGISCPEQGCNGYLRESRTKKGRVFFSCNRYPDCKFAEWNRPIPELCPKCGWTFLVEKKGKKEEGILKCGREGCDYQRPL
ncbi:MAG: type I DNA topoisomerase [Nitrospinae bacterium]|nr:type I DNA topoisomerase [Nitrospinota bacterium]